MLELAKRDMLRHAWQDKRDKRAHQLTKRDMLDKRDKLDKRTHQLTKRDMLDKRDVG